MHKKIKNKQYIYLTAIYYTASSTIRYNICMYVCVHVCMYFKKYLFASKYLFF